MNPVQFRLAVFSEHTAHVDHHKLHGQRSERQKFDADIPAVGLVENFVALILHLAHERLMNLNKIHRHQHIAQKYGDDDD